MSEEGFVRIGMADLHASLQRVAEGNQRLESKMDTALSIQTLRLEYLSKELGRLEQQLAADKKELAARVDELERRPVVTPKAMMTAITIMGIVVGAVGTILNVVLR